MDFFTLIALSPAWSLSIGIIFTFGILMPAVATVLIVVSMVSGRGDKAMDEQNAGRWGRKPDA